MATKVASAYCWLARYWSSLVPAAPRHTQTGWRRLLTHQCLGAAAVGALGGVRTPPSAALMRCGGAKISIGRSARYSAGRSRPCARPQKRRRRSCSRRPTPHCTQRAPTKDVAGWGHRPRPTSAKAWSQSCWVFLIQLCTFCLTAIQRIAGFPSCSGSDPSFQSSDRETAACCLGNDRVPLAPKLVTGVHINEARRIG